MRDHDPAPIPAPRILPNPDVRPRDVGKKGKRKYQKEPKSQEEISRDLKRAKRNIEERERYWQNEKKRITKLQERLDKGPTGSPLSQLYSPESTQYLPGPSRRVVVALPRADVASLPAAVEALDLNDTPEPPRRLAARGAATGRPRPANRGQRLPASVQRRLREVEEEEQEEAEKKEGKKKEKTD